MRSSMTDTPVKDIAVMYKEEELGTIDRKVFAIGNTLCVLYKCKAYKVLHKPPKGLCISLHNSIPLR